MRTLLLIVLIALFSVFGLYSQEKKELTIEDAVVGVWRQYYPKTIRGLGLKPDSKEFSKIENNSLLALSYDLKKENVLLTLDELNRILQAKNIEELSSLKTYEWIDNNKIRLFPGNNVIEIDLKTKSVLKFIKVSDDVENADFCAENGMIAYTIGNNLNIINEKGEVFQVSNERDQNIVYGQTVSRNEFGISKGTFWSPKGSYLAFYKKDESNVTDYPLVNTSTRIATLKNIKYPMAGMESEIISVGIYDIKNKKTIYLETEGEKYQYLTNITWSPDEKFIYVAVLNRAQKHMKFNCYRVSDGKFVKTLFEEKNEKYVEPLHPGIFLPKDPNKFLWQSRRDNYSHLYLYDTDGNLIRQVTKGNFEVQEVYGFTEDGKDIIILANKETPIDFDIYRVNIETGAMLRVTKHAGSHIAIVSKDGSVIIDQFSSTTIPNQINIIDTKGKLINTVLLADNPLKDFNLAKMEIGTIKADDGITELYYRLISPPDLDPTKKYPAIIYVYGGPHAQLITNRWLGGAAGWDYYMAQKGYVVFTLDNRGSANRGLEFENVIYGNCGEYEMRDQMTGIEFLKNLGYIDMDRIGVHGWSYGGFMTINLALTYPDIFKVAVAGGPVTNWEYYEVMYGERYMGNPKDNIEGYKKSNLLEKVENLKGRLLIIHGAQDPVVVWQHSLAFLQKSIEKKVLVDYFVYPEHEHNVRGLDRVHLMRLVTRYFEENL